MTKPSEEARPVSEPRRDEVIAAMAWLDQMSAQIKTHRDRLKHELDRQARDEYATRGTLPVWKVPGLATVSSSATNTKIIVADVEAFTEWVRERYPSEIRTRTFEEVAPSWQEMFLKTALVAGSEVADCMTNELVPGLKVEQGGQFIGVSVRATTDAKRLFGVAADRGLAAAAVQAGPMVAPAFALPAGPSTVDGEQ